MPGSLTSGAPRSTRRARAGAAPHHTHQRCACVLAAVAGEGERRGGGALTWMPVQEVVHPQVVPLPMDAPQVLRVQIHRRAIIALRHERVPHHHTPSPSPTSAPLTHLLKSTVYTAVCASVHRGNTRNGGYRSPSKTQQQPLSHSPPPQHSYSRSHLCGATAL